jgi:hypothetical protein
MPSALHSEASLQDHQALVRALTSGGFMHLKLAVGFALADAAILYTVPTGLRLELQNVYWEVTTSWTGGTNSAIGLSSSAYTTKGSLLGNTAGDLTAQLASTGVLAKGCRGSAFTGATAGVFAATSVTGGVVLVGGDTIRFDRIASVYTAGAGYAHITARSID